MKDILITDGAILTEKGWIERGYIHLENGTIKTIQAGDPPNIEVGQTIKLLSAQHCALLPGMVNGHTHLSQSFMRGLAGGRPLINWLKELIWPLQDAITKEELYLAALLGLVENLRCGVTELTNHHKITRTQAHTQAVVRAAREVGLRMTLAHSWSDKGKNAESKDTILANLDQLFKMLQGEERVKAANGPLALWRCSAETLRLTHVIALDHSSITHFHVAESLDEIRMSMDEYGMRPVEWLENIGMLGQETQIVHAVWVEDEEIALIAKAKAPVIHCPVSNAVIGSGIAPVAKMLRHGIALRLGTDGAASNDTQDIWETMKFAVSLVSATTCNPTDLPPKQALELATGGKTLNPGQPADLIIVDLNHPRLVPIHDLYSALVLGAHGSDVKTVIVDGEILMEDGKVLCLDEASLLNECRYAIKALRKRANIQCVSLD